MASVVLSGAALVLCDCEVNLIINNRPWQIRSRLVIVTLHDSLAEMILVASRWGRVEVAELVVLWVH